MKKYTLIILILIMPQFIPKTGTSQNIRNEIFLTRDNTSQERELLNSSSGNPTNHINKIPQKTPAQLAVTPYLVSGYTPSTLVQNVLVSGCLVASNITFTGDNAALGSFDANGSNFALANGIIISTGNVTNAVGPNQFTNATTQFTNFGDADLNIITGSNSTRDAAVLEFDFVPANNTVEFRYIFASEEYPEWACGTFNDVFAFLLSGPGIVGGQGFSNDAKNIALLPNNITPVTINNIHIGGWNQGISETSHNPLTCPDMNPAYYINNAGSTSIEYDGMTAVLTAHWTVIPCQTYHIKFAISDVADRKWDSGVFIEGASFTSNPVSMNNFNLNGNLSNNVYEGCDYNLVFSRNNLNNASPLTIHYSITGTSNALDHNFPSDSVIIPAGINSISVPYSIIADGIPESSETLTISIGNGCPCSANAILKTLTLYDELTLTTNTTPISCNGFSNGIIMATANGGSGSYLYSINGGTLQSSNVFTNLGPGTYIIMVDDGASCSTVADTILLTDPTVLSMNTSLTTNISCYNGSNAVITSIASGGWGNYLYNINGGAFQTSGVFSGLIDGTYIIGVSDGFGCTISDTITISQPTQLSSVISYANDASCNRFFDGSAIITASGGTPGYTYLWSNGETSANNNYLSADTYFVTVTDNNGCTTTNSIIINEPTLLTATITSSTNASCNGNADGSSTVLGGGGIPPYSYLWSNGDTTAIINNLTAGVYIVTITDAHGCVISATDTITEPNPIIPNINVITEIVCFGGMEASAFITATGGVPPYTFLWSNGSSNDTIFNLVAGTYTVTITDITGCIKSATISINEPPLLVASIALTNISCFGMADGAAIASASGGTSPYSYNWSNGNTSNTISNHVAGTYMVTVTDINGCTATASAIIVEPVLLTTLVNPPTNTTCFNASNGLATVVPYGGTSPYSYNWSNGSNSATASSLASGTYYVTVTDNNGCTSTNSVIINQPPQLITTISSSVNLLCNGGANGSATVNASGGVPPYSYQWSNGSNNTTISNLTAGTYTVTVTDNNGCTATNSVAITQPNVLNAVITPTHILCNAGNSGSATVTASGGTTPYNYNWSNGSHTATISNLTAGTYSVTVTDANGCTATATTLLTEPTMLTTVINPPTNVICFNSSNGSATVVPTGGTSPYSYNWSNGNTTATASGLISGTYTVTVTDNNGCTSTNSVFINQPPQLITTISSIINILCNGGTNGSATVSASGGVPAYSYLWSTGSTGTTISNLPAGTYVVTVTDNNGCTATNSVTITQPNPLTANITRTNVLCFGGNTGTAFVTVTGGTTPYSYNWSNGSNSSSISNLVAGTYSVTVTDANGCTATASKVVSQPNVLTTTMNPPTNTTCFNASNGSATVVASGGSIPYSYNWSSGSTSATAAGISSGTYTVTVTDAHGCTATNSVFINQPPQLTSSISSTTTVSCNGGNNGTATVAASGGIPPYSYLWSNGTTNAINSGMSAGNYTVTVTDNNGCTSISIATINQSTLLVASLLSLNGTSCYGGTNGSAEATATGGNMPYSYSWSNGVNNAVNGNLPAGNYTVTITDVNGCSASTTAIVNQPDLLVPAITSSNVSCYGGNNGSATVNPVGGTPSYTFLWSNGNNTQSIDNLVTGTYSVTVTDINGCSASNSVTLIQPPITINISSSLTDISCFGANNGSAQIFVSGNTGPYDYIWSNNATSDAINGLSAGTYSVTVTDSFGCVLSTSVTINEPALLTANASVINNVSCHAGANGMAEVIANGGLQPYSYLWSNGLQSASVSGLAAGSYQVTVTDLNGCTANSSVTITEPTLLSSGITAFGNVSCFSGNNGTATVAGSGGVMPYTYLWSNGNIAATNNNIAAGNYTVTVTDANGCNATSAVSISQPGQIVIAMNVYSNVSCFNGNDGSAGAVVSGGVSPYSYLWSNGSVASDISNLTAGQYNLSVTDQNGCVALSSVTIMQPNQNIFINITTTDVSCASGTNGSATATVTGNSGPYSYLWSNNAGTPSITNLTVGTYLLTVTNAAGCVMTSSATINEPIVLSVQITSTNVSCFNGNNGSIGIAVSGGTSPYSYLWSNGSISPALTGIMAGTYSVSITDLNGCSVMASAIVTQPTQLNAVTSGTNVLCHGGNTGTATIIASGGTLPYSYTWSNNANTATVTGMVAGNYSVTVTDANQCSYINSIVLTQPALLMSQIVSSADASCFGYQNGSAGVSASGGVPPYSYLWDVNGDTNAFCEQLGAGLHQVSVTDHNGCVSVSSVTIAQPTQVIITTNGDATLCQGNTTTISAHASGGTAPYVYTWDPASGNTSTVSILVMDSTTYFVFATDSNGCTSDTGSITISMYDRLKAAISGNNSICIGDTTLLDLVIVGGLGPYTYIWDNGIGNQPVPFAVSPAVTTTYMVTVFDACNSTPSVASITITVHPLPVANVSADNLKGCGNLNATFIDNNYLPYNTYVWDFGDPQAGADNHSGDSTPTHFYSEVGVYNLSLTVTTEFGCSAFYEYPQLVAIFDKPNASFKVNPLTVTLEDPLVFCKDESFDAVNWSWDFDEPSSGSLNISTEKNPHHKYSEIGNHTIWLYVENIHGCVDSTSKEIQVLDYYTFFAPNAFTPNGDGLNDEFLIQGSGLMNEGFSMMVFDRWGELVFESSDINRGWNGSVKNIGKLCPDGIYTWTAVAKDEMGLQHSYNGNVTIVK